MVRVTGKLTFPVFASAVIVPPTPTFTVAIAIKFTPVGPGISTIPPPVVVAATARRSGVGVEEAENNKVLTPGVIGAGALLVQSKLKVTSVGAMGLEGVRAKIKHPAPLAGISTGVLGDPTGRLVAQFVAWKKKAAGRLEMGERLQPRAVAVP